MIGLVLRELASGIGAIRWPIAHFRRPEATAAGEDARATSGGGLAGPNRLILCEAGETFAPRGALRKWRATWGFAARHPRLGNLGRCAARLGGVRHFSLRAPRCMGVE